jgi:beta-glucosidase
VNLQPGESRTVAFRIGPDAFSLYDRQMRKVVEPGSFSIFVGTDSEASMTARVDVSGDMLVLAPSTPRFH